MALLLPAAAVAVTLVTTAFGLGPGTEGWPTSALTPQFPDCEAFRSGFLRQPTTAVTSLAFVPIGIWIAVDRRVTVLAPRWLMGLAVAFVGVGSFLAHAAATDWARTTDSLAIKVMLVTFIVGAAAQPRNWDLVRLLAWWAGAAAAAVAIELTMPAAARPLLAVLVVAAAAGSYLVSDAATRRWWVGGVAVIGVGAFAWGVSRSGSGLCSPQAVFQLHGLWHILAAAGIASVYQVYRTEVT